MNDGELQTICDFHHWPLVKLAVKVKQEKNLIGRSVSGLPVVQVIFDPYMQNVVAPDHLLSSPGNG